MPRLTTLLIGLLLVSNVRAELKLAPLFSDHAVLQSDKELSIWGWADSGETVTVQLGESKATATADESRKWVAKLPKQVASDSPVELIVTGSSGESVKRTDILIGEVWIGSGQSNMAMGLKRTENADEFIKKADHPRIRLFVVARNATTKPASEVSGEWVICSPQSVPDFSAVLYHFGLQLHDELKVPVGLIQSAWGGTPIQAWMPIDAFGQDSREHADYQKRIEQSYPSATQSRRPALHLRRSYLYNGMIDPLVPYAIRGVTWYQGENNVTQNEASIYADLMKRMVVSWRDDFGQGDWPFLFVQLAPFGKYKSGPTALCEMWEAQTTAATTIPNAWMAPTSDIGEADNIHPKQKQQVGRRLARIALANVYRIPGGSWNLPQYKSHAIEGGKIRIAFIGVGDGLKSRDGKPLSNFEIAGEDGVFTLADSRIDGSDVIVWSDKVPNPKSARFGWSATASPNLVNTNGAPPVAFRTRN